ncbi:MAG: hypothetical protein R2695_00495 [Acidimicrobiales bacterium]
MVVTDNVADSPPPTDDDTLAALRRGDAEAFRRFVCSLNPG